MKILITGGTGFIGSNLCSELLKQHHIVYCMDNNFTGSLENIAEHMDNNNFKLRHKKNYLTYNGKVNTEKTLNYIFDKL